MNVSSEQSKERELAICELYNKRYSSNKRYGGSYLCPRPGPYASTDATFIAGRNKLVLARVEFKIRRDNLFTGDGHWKEADIWCQVSKALYDFVEGSPHYLVNIALTKDYCQWTDDLYGTLIPSQQKCYARLVKDLYQCWLDPKRSRTSYKDIGLSSIGDCNLRYDPLHMYQGTIVDFFNFLRSEKQRRLAMRRKAQRHSLLNILPPEPFPFEYSAEKGIVTYRHLVGYLDSNNLIAEFQGYPLYRSNDTIASYGEMLHHLRDLELFTQIVNLLELSHNDVTIQRKNNADCLIVPIVGELQSIGE